MEKLQKLEKLIKLDEIDENWSKLILERGDWDNELFNIEIISDETEVIIRAHDLFGSRTCVLMKQDLTQFSEQIISCDWSELFVGQNNLVEIGGVMWDLTSTTSEQLILMSNLSNINSSDLGIPDGRIVAAGCDGIWIENEQILYVWKISKSNP